MINYKSPRISIRGAPSGWAIVRAARCGGVGHTEGTLRALLRRGHT